MKWALVLTTALLSAIPLASQSSLDWTVSEPGDPPSRVARLNWMRGDVSFQPAGLDEWASATLNYPLTASDHLFTAKEARAELHIGQNVIRLDGNSNFGFVNLDDSIVQVSLTQGSMQIDLFRLPQGDTFEIGTPNGAITILGPGDYRIDTNPDRDETMLTVRSGQAEISYGLSSVAVRAQETALFRTSQLPEVRAANKVDAFDAFTTSRAEAVSPEPPSYGKHDPSAEDSPTIPEMLAAGMTGAEDLAAYGTWETTTGYGQTWIPPVEAGWVPYSNGNWTFVEPWGWTWVDAAPWGFTPFHYGRWVYAGHRWVWAPPSLRRKPYYAPALVMFMGGGPADRVSWVALAPEDVWTPTWKTSVDIVGGWRGRPAWNRYVTGAVVSLSQLDFAAGARERPKSGLAPDGSMLGSSPNVMPTRESLLMRPSRVRPLAFNRSLILKTPPPLPPIVFAAKTTLLSMAPGRPLTPKQIAMLRRQNPGAVMQQSWPVRSGTTRRPNPGTTGAINGIGTGVSGGARQGGGPTRR